MKAVWDAEIARIVSPYRATNIKEFSETLQLDSMRCLEISPRPLRAFKLRDVNTSVRMHPPVCCSFVYTMTEHISIDINMIPCLASNAK